MPLIDASSFRGVHRVVRSVLMRGIKFLIVKCSLWCKSCCPRESGLGEEL